MLKFILEYKSLELAHLRRKIPLKDVQLMANNQEPARNFLANFSTHSLAINIIAEIKKASPSAGLINPEFATNFDPVRIARIYAENGARALSVLTDEKFFQGSLENLRRVKSAVKLPVLRKDFTLGEYHIFEGRAVGADAILLIAAALDPYQLKDYHALVQDLGMTALVEVHNEVEIKKISAFAPKLVGINNRDLATLEVDSGTTEKLLPKIFWKSVIISESGLKDHEALVKLVKKGVEGFLIGESLLRGNVGENLQNMLMTPSP